MEFTLHYRGPLRANRKPREKHELRREFHRQLKVLWGQPPFDEIAKYLHDEARPGDLSGEFLGAALGPHVNITCRKGLFTFAPLVCSRLHLTARLAITLLRPGPPGSLVKEGGDIDNRLKTLLDALKAPLEPSDLPAGAMPAEGEDPFFCLFEDDSLITGLSVETDRLLEPSFSQSEALLLIKVRLSATTVTLGNVGLLG